jgi:hypothetical protein
MLEVSCQKCGSHFMVKPSWVKNGYGKYCSPDCRRAAQRTGKEILCHVCQKETYKPGKALKGTKSGLLFCGKSCQTKWRNTEFKEEKHANWKGGTHAYRRIMKQSDKPPICGLCKTTDIRVLAVHHLDENRKNNMVENLAWLCHNCHLLIHHYPDERDRFMAAIV